MSFFVKRDQVPVELGDHVPKVVQRLLHRIFNETFSQIALYGFGDNMKWLFRLLRESGKEPILCDWRPTYVGYDCGGSRVIHVNELDNNPQILLVSCLEEIQTLKASFRYLIGQRLDRMSVIYDRADPHSPFHQESPFKDIAAKARKRAISMISDNQLFDLIQFIRATSDVPGDIVEFGSLYGGSGAVLVEAVNYYAAGKKPVWLFDTFAGIPKSRYGLDHRWNNAFSNNSYCEVKDAFKDCANVKVIQGNICETYNQVKSPISFGYIASDTMETGKILLEFIWPKLSPGGIIAICDYGSYPNCIPLTVITDMYFEDKKDAIIFHPHPVGFFAMKRP